MNAGQIVNGTKVLIDSVSQKSAIKLLNFLSGAVQIMPLDLCGELIPKILKFAEIEDPLLKVNAYLTLEVLFASRRFNQDNQSSMVLSQTLKSLLDNPEIIQNVSF